MSSIELLNDLWNIDDSHNRQSIWQNQNNPSAANSQVGAGVAAARSTTTISSFHHTPTHPIAAAIPNTNGSPPLSHHNLMQGTYPILSKTNSNCSNSSSNSSTSVSSLLGSDFDYYHDSNYTTNYYVPKLGPQPAASTNTAAATTNTTATTNAAATANSSPASSTGSASPTALTPMTSSNSDQNLPVLDKKPVNTQLYKTELCGSYMKYNYCPYGNKCQFAHGQNELKSVERPANWRSKPCANWSKYGSCRYGNRCCFKH